jgi:putative membrane protein
MSTGPRANIPLPDGPAPEHVATKASLEKLSGRPFDLAYMQAQIVDHQKTIILLQYEIGQGQNAGLQRFAAETLPAVLAHLEAAKSITAELILSGAQVSGR